MITTSALTGAVLTAPVLTAFQNKPVVDFYVSPDTQTLLSKVAFWLVVAWIAFIIGQQVIPGARRGGGKVQWNKLIWVVPAAIILMDVSILKTVANGGLDFLWGVGGIVGLTA